MTTRPDFYRTSPPPEALRRFIESFWLYEGYCPAHEQERVLPTGTLIRIELRYLGQDTRVVLREERLVHRERAAKVLELLAPRDKRASSPWTQSLLHLIGRHPGASAGDLVRLGEMEVMRLKRRVRALKELGLTESLVTGYRLSRRGRDLLEFIRHSKH